MNVRLLSIELYHQPGNLTQGTVRLGTCIFTLDLIREFLPEKLIEDLIRLRLIRLVLWFCLI